MKEYSSRLHREFVDVVPEQVQVGEEALEETSMEEHSQLRRPSIRPRSFKRLS